MEANKSCGITHLNNHNEAALSDLNDDVLWEILGRVSLDTLERCRLSSKKINEYTNSRMFLDPFYSRSDILVGFVYQITQRCSYAHHFLSISAFNIRDKKKPLFPWSFLPQSVRIKACSNVGGLMYCRSAKVPGRARSNYLCKPTTKEWVEIPNQRTSGFKTEAYALVVKTTRPLIYSIFHFSASHTPNTRDYTMICEIFDSTTLSWRRAKDIKFESFTTLVKKESPIYMKGVLHFLTSSRRIFAFDLRTETWELKQLPEQIVESRDNVLKLDQGNGKLILFEIIYHDEEWDKVQYWMMADYTKETWKKLHMSKYHRIHAIGYYSRYNRVVCERKYRKTKFHTYVDMKADYVNPLVFYQNFIFISDCEPVFARVESAPTSDLTTLSKKSLPSSFWEKTLRRVKEVFQTIDIQALWAEAPLTPP